MSMGVQSRLGYYQRNREALRARSKAFDRLPGNRQKKRARNNARYHYLVERIITAFDQLSDDPESLFYRGAEE